MSKVIKIIEDVAEEIKDIVRYHDRRLFTEIECQIEFIKRKAVEAVKVEEIVYGCELVRCVECRHGQHNGEDGVICEWGGEEMRPYDHFCGWAERRNFCENNEEDED